MAVLTALTSDHARSLVRAYGFDEFSELRGIPAGSVNSNFALEAGGRRLFLRIYEERDVAGAERETAMLVRLAKAGVPTPAPLSRTDGQLVSRVDGKAAALFPWRDGTMRCQAGVTPTDAHRIGAALAQVHVASAAEELEPNRFAYEPLILRLDRIAASGHPVFAPMVPSLRDALARTHHARYRGLPSGLIHSDLFRDNVLWGTDGHISALLDFESACEGTFAYDLMVTVLAWSFSDGFDAQLAAAMRRGYETVRPLGEDERRALGIEGCFAALRFTITRITDYAMRSEAAGPRVVKDWRRFFERFERLVALGDHGVQRLLGLSGE